MSEYQYYEFRAVDRALTGDEMEDIAGLSSRGELSPYRAAFVYNYGDFRADAGDVLFTYFDAMIYLANWGSRRLMFRFPEAAVDIDKIRRYCYQELIILEVSEGYAVLDIYFNDEEACAWLEGEIWLPRLISLRQDLMRQDYRLLYLAWLKAIMLEPPDEADVDAYTHPPVPPGLKNLSQPLEDFVELFELDEFLVRTAAKTSSQRKEITEDALRDAVSKLPTDECRTFLFRMASGETNLSGELNLRLNAFLNPDPGEFSKNADGRSILKLLEDAEREKELEAERKRAEEEAKRIKRLETLSVQAPRLWNKVGELIAVKQTKAYDEAVEILLQLKELAEYEGGQVEFQERITRLHKAHTRLSGLRWRLEENGLKPG